MFVSCEKLEMKKVIVEGKKKERLVLLIVGVPYLVSREGVEGGGRGSWGAWRCGRHGSGLDWARRLGLWDSTLPARALVCRAGHAHDGNPHSLATHTALSTTRAHRHPGQEKLYPRGGNLERGGEARTHAPPLALSVRLLDGDY